MLFALAIGPLDARRDQDRAGLLAGEDETR